jgi:hypothetical protein
MQQALSALVTAELDGNCEYGVTDSLRARLAQPEPWVKTYSGGKPNYTEPKEWFGLTDEEVSQMEKDYLWGGKEFNAELGYWAVYRAIEAKLKEKNT